MHAARGIVTARGGMTSHAAVVARGMGAPASPAPAISTRSPRTFTARGRTFKAGEIITIDGSKGEVLDGAVAMIEPELTGDFADPDGLGRQGAPPQGARQCRDAAGRPHRARFGAEGIGLCRTEHMFFDDTRIAAVREMILADDEAGRRVALAKIAPFQKSPTSSNCSPSWGLPVTVRLLDPPLHEFLPHTDEDIDALAETSGIDAAKLKRRARELHETNPMLGHRGAASASPIRKSTRCRCGPFSKPRSRSSQTGAEAPIPRSCIRWSLWEEMKYLRELTDRTAKAVLRRRPATPWSIWSAP
jgi:pyruvate,orthophosphate dikinase